MHHHRQQPCRSFFTHILPLALRLPSGLPLYRPLRRQAVQTNWPKTASCPHPSLATASSGNPGLSPPGHSGGDNTSLLAGVPCPLITPLPSPTGPFYPPRPTQSRWSMPFLEIWPTMSSKPCWGTLCHCKPKQESFRGPRVLQDGSLSPINALAALYTLPLALAAVASFSYTSLTAAQTCHPGTCPRASALALASLAPGILFTQEYSSLRYLLGWFPHSIRSQLECYFLQQASTVPLQHVL